MNPDDAQRLRGLLGMARRAGRLTTGFDAVCDRIVQRKTSLVLLAADLSEKTAKELRYAAQSGPAVRRLPLDKAALGACLGSAKPIGVLSVNDTGFASALKVLCSEPNTSINEEECPYDDKIPRE